MGFRWFVKEAAESFGLTGWVSNKEDGAVEAEIQGSAAVLEEFLSRAKTGNPAARVNEIVTRPQAAKHETTFRII